MIKMINVKLVFLCVELTGLEEYLGENNFLESFISFLDNYVIHPVTSGMNMTSSHVVIYNYQQVFSRSLPPSLEIHLGKLCIHCHIPSHLLFCI